MESGRLRVGQRRGICACVVASIIALAVVPAHANAASPVLEYVAPGASFPIAFDAEGGAVTAELDDPGFESVVNCTGSDGGGEITGPQSTKSQYVFTGCKAVGGSHSDQECKSGGANAEEIVSEEIEADLVYLDQAKHEAAMLLNPGGGTYMTFECGGEEVEALGSFLSPVDPINEMATSFEAILASSESQQVPSEYEGPGGETLEAIPTGKREGHEPVPTGVALAFTIEPSTELEIKAVSAEEVEAKQQEEEAAKKSQEEEAAAKKRQEEEAAAAAARQRQAEEAATRQRQAEEAAARQRQEEAIAARERQRRVQAKRRRIQAAKKRRRIARAKAKRRRVRARRLSKALKRCRKLDSKRRRIRCVRRVRKKYGGHRGTKKHNSHRAAYGRHHVAAKSF